MAKYDTVAGIMAWESGEMDDAEAVVFFQHLIDTGVAWTLQGNYGRVAKAMIERGLCKPPGGLSAVVAEAKDILFNRD